MAGDRLWKMLLSGAIEDEVIHYECFGERAVSRPNYLVWFVLGVFAQPETGVPTNDLEIGQGKGD